ncbi:carotenoid oxygenase family protein [Sporosarcina sp. P1]|uniref:carotenoid oxygenase family protein n=1 Tax=Sporosarcina sp. P1 TaxID=2048257 RepID=UPI0018ECDC70|nr:carotenoid oxygenase family protein [Sporosarcina sp. P1]
MTGKNSIEGSINEHNPYLHRKLYSPIDQELDILDCEVLEGHVPNDFHGSYVRNGPNPQFEPKGRHHWYDGDGMLHAVYVEDGRVSYRNKYIQTEVFEREKAAGQTLWGGLFEDPKNNPADMPIRDTSWTDVIFHNSNLLTLYYGTGVPYKVDPKTLETIGKETFKGKLLDKVSAHAKVDEHTGEMLFFDYFTKPPYMTYGVVSADGELTTCVPINLPGARLPHDMAFTKHYSILMDLPLFHDEEALKNGRYKIKFYRDLPARFGIIPRHGTSDQLRWFEAKPCYIYHVVNSWEDGDEVVMVGCRMPEPIPDISHIKRSDWVRRMSAIRKLKAYMYYWRFNLKTGKVTEGPLDDMVSEFPVVNLSYAGRKSNYSYHVLYSPEEDVSFEGIAKYDISTGAKSEKYLFGKGRYGNEPAFAPRINSKTEDDGYVLTFVYDEIEDRSELLILDAQHFSLGPIARIKMPQRVPMGAHATWVQGDQL